MNGFIDPVRGEMAAVDCAYEHDKAGCRAAPSCRIEGEIRSIVWVRAADALRAPKLVRLADGQIAEMAAQVWGRASIAPQSIMGFARIVEAAVLRANNLETPE